MDNNVIMDKIKNFVDLRNSYADLQNLALLYPKNNIEYFQHNFERTIATNNNFNFIEQLSCADSIELICPIHNSVAICRHSVPLVEANALYFQGVEPFYVLQGNFCVEAFYYPNHSIFILLRGALDYEISLTRLIFILENKEKELKGYYSKRTNFSGLYCFHQSPFHYYYFKVSHLLPVLSKVKTIKELTVYSLPGKSYLDLSKVCPKIKHNKIINKMFSLDEQVKNSNFYVFVGEHRKKLTLGNIQYCDELVTKFLLNTDFNNVKINQIQNLKKTHYILWVGLTSGKRSWVEQVLAYKALIEKLVDVIQNIVVVTDGWTKGKAFNSESPDGDSKLVKALMSYFSGNLKVKFIDLVGEDAEVKTKVALDVDFFVANHATGSIWVSRVAGRPGVTHISNVARGSSINQHVHPNAQLMPSSDVTDIESVNATTPFHVSYSITVNDFLKICLPLALKFYEHKKIKEFSKQEFGKLRFSEQTNPADALRDIALVFEKIGDIDIAYTIMEKAFEQRPNGPFIKEKVNEFKLKAKNK